MRRTIRQRDINSQSRSLTGDANTSDSFATYLVKYIPAESITALGVLQAADYTPYTWVIGIVVVLNFLYLRFLYNVDSLQMFVSYVALGVWVLLLGGPDVKEFYAVAAPYANLSPETFKQVFVPGATLFATLLGPIWAKLDDRFVLNR